MEWDNDSCLSFIKMYQNERILWDPKHPQYHSKNKKQDAWETIASNLKFDVEETKKKMNSLLGSFRRERAKVKNSVRTGKSMLIQGDATATSGLKDVYRSRWFAYESMQFLLDRDEPRNSFNAVHVDVKEMDTSGEDTTDTKFFQNYSLEDGGMQQALEYESFSTPGQPKLKRQKNQDRNEDPPIEEGSQILKSPFSAAIPHSDECSVYGQHIANKLRSYTAKTRALVEHAINNVLFEADMGKLEYVPCASSCFRRHSFNPNCEKLEHSRAAQMLCTISHPSTNNANAHACSCVLACAHVPACSSPDAP